jgi:signal transduction histidine kinase
MASSARKQAGGSTGSAAMEAVGGGEGAARQTRLLSEISHELGNYFHKLYYWAEVLREPRAGGADAETAILLERTVRELETFLKTALELFRPITIAPMALRIGELAASVRAVLGRQVEPLPLAWREEGTEASGTVSVDPGRFSFVLDGMVRRVVGPDATGVAAVVATEASAERTVAVTLAASGGQGSQSVSVGAAIEWAVIERVVELHGGSIRAETGEDRRVTLRLPIRS